MKDQIEILILGIGGQGVLTLGDLIINIFNEENYKISMSNFYASQMRGGEVGCVVKINFNNEEILNPMLSSVDYFLVLNDEFLEKYKKYQNENSKFLYIDDKKEKYQNVIMLKKFINTINEEYKKEGDIGNLVSDDIVLEILEKRFRNDLFLKLKDLYENLS